MRRAGLAGPKRARDFSGCRTTSEMSTTASYRGHIAPPGIWGAMLPAGRMMKSGGGPASSCELGDANRYGKGAAVEDLGDEFGSTEELKTCDSDGEKQDADEGAQDVEPAHDDGGRAEERAGVGG